MILSQRLLLALLAGLLSLATAQEPGATCTAGTDAAVVACDQGHYCEAVAGACAGAGTCTGPPVTCDTIWDPVCGCDAVTYFNACQAAGEGVNVQSQGACEVTGSGVPPAGACYSDATCDEGQYCSFELWACESEDAVDAPGNCEDIPERCTEELQPVCGCNDQTYDNACWARFAGVSLKSQGTCEVTAVTGGGVPPTGACDDDAACNEGQYCSFELGACESEDAVDALGNCEDIPKMCTEELQSVCGCNDQSYDNACWASFAGISLKSQGTCEVTTVTGGGVPQAGACRDAAACDEGQYCSFAVGACWQEYVVDAPGNCEDIPKMCTEEPQFVCGCNNQSYDNACWASFAGVNLKSQRACKLTETVGVGFPLADGCADDAACNGGQYCSFALGACGAVDALGKCDDIPGVCTEEFRPVCGCNDETYDNPCFARAAGISVKSDGECAGAGGGCTAGDATCGAGKFCETATAGWACSETGECTSVPETCLRNIDKVCGCDDTTYDNACQARSKGVSVKAQGRCGGLAESGGACNIVADPYGSRDTCGSGNVCQAAAVGACDGPGTCIFEPDLCPTDIALVCGCDDTTYDNECTAHSNGVSIKGKGKCETATDVNGDAPAVAGGEGGDGCYCADDAACDVGGYCRFAMGACGSAVSGGKCDSRPETCTAQYQPVCGCDDATYSNACEAKAAGVSVKSEGECAPGIVPTAPESQAKEGIPGTVAPTLKATPIRAPTIAPMAAPTSVPTEEDPDDLVSAGRRCMQRIALGAGLVLALALGRV